MVSPAFDLCYVVTGSAVTHVPVIGKLATRAAASFGGSTGSEAAATVPHTPLAPEPFFAALHA